MPGYNAANFRRRLATLDKRIAFAAARLEKLLAQAEQAAAALDRMREEIATVDRLIVDIDRYNTTVTNSPAPIATRRGGLPNDALKEAAVGLLQQTSEGLSREDLYQGLILASHAVPGQVSFRVWLSRLRAQGLVYFDTPTGRWRVREATP